MTYPLVQELAAEGIPVRLTCGVLGFSPQAFYKWQANPVTDRDNLQQTPESVPDVYHALNCHTHSLG